MFLKLLFTGIFLVVCQQGEATQPGTMTTCLSEWMRQGGIPANKSRQYERTLREASVSEIILKSKYVSAAMLSYMMKGDSESAVRLKKCITGKIAHCHGYNPCKEGGTCIFNSSRKINTCVCQKGLYGDLCEKDCNECVLDSELSPAQCLGAKHNCHDNATCTNTHGSFGCSCKKGFRGNGLFCEDDTECDRKLCSRHGTCNDTFGSYICTCLAGYQGNGKVCKRIRYCLSRPCQNGGKCQNYINRYTCHCAIGYEGAHCEKPINHCRPNPCKNGGTCVDRQVGTCLCKFGFGGENCTDLLGASRHSAAPSCKHLHLAGVLQSGMYWVSPSSQPTRALKVYCDMTAGGGWMRVTDINPLQYRACPPGFKRISSPKSLCLSTRRAGGCASAFFTTHGIPYSEVRGFAYGYQYNSVDGFQSSKSQGLTSIDQSYVDGISITRGSPREHVWTFAVGISQVYSLRTSNCPCAQYPGPSPPSCVGNDYYCESGNTGSHIWGGWYMNQRLWDGKCYSRSNCCNSPTMPYFVKSLGRSSVDRVEVRLCRNSGDSNENVAIEKLQLFVR